ncbi:unnamed protein product [Cylicostephanus goldi]|uniref:Uncharacterized protein n=1 Tax=Cylicostephanus goldi TaxID=71465 RepID=A0A3P7N1T5_CYLGO|nr:unnamed protein product [Cylicostephanus goldi]
MRWSRFRSDALCIVGSKSPAASRMVAKALIMLSRLLTSQISRRVLQAQTFRFIRTTALAAASEHEGPPPVYEPKPRELREKRFLRRHEEHYPGEPHKPGKNDYLSYLGAGLGVVLTALAVIYYGDIFGTGKKSTTTKHVSKPAAAKTQVQALISI